MVRIKCRDCMNTDCGNAGTGLTVLACCGYTKIARYGVEILVDETRFQNSVLFYDTEAERDAVAESLKSIVPVRKWATTIPKADCVPGWLIVENSMNFIQ